MVAAREAVVASKRLERLLLRRRQTTRGCVIQRLVLIIVEHGGVTLARSLWHEGGSAPPAKQQVPVHRRQPEVALDLVSTANTAAKASRQVPLQELPHDVARRG